MLDGQWGERMRLAGWEADERRAALVAHPAVRMCQAGALGKSE
jgi:hypothetical protein